MRRCQHLNGLNGWYLNLDIWNIAIYSYLINRSCSYIPVYHFYCWAFLTGASAVCSPLSRMLLCGVSALEQSGFVMAPFTLESLGMQPTFLLWSSGGSHMSLLVWLHLHSCNNMIEMIHTHTADLSTLPVSVFWVSSSPPLLLSQRRTLHCVAVMFIQMWDAPEMNHGSSELAA